MLKRLLTLVVFLALVTVHSFSSSGQASALSGSEFNAGRIMDDSIFFNGTTMNTGDIQAFLNAKMPSCDTNGTAIYSGSTTRAQYGASRGYPAPYTCLKDYSQQTTTKSPDAYCAGHTAGVKSSAQIIYEVAQSCGVNPRVLIVLLQKEQSLITDEWPWSIQYRSATGYGCPDTAPCDAEYYGFFNQVYAAARIYKYYAANPTFFNYRAGRDNYVLYNPNTACGGSNVFIQNQATAGLYIYTPYQPNTAALNNLYGSGDSCSAYGNRNFWRMYNDWFGFTIGNGYEFVDAINPPSTLLPNDVVGARIRIRNTSGTTWYSDGNVPTGQHAFRLATFGYQNTPYGNTGDPNWLGTKNQIKMKETSVANGEIATFELSFKAPLQQVNNYLTQFTPVYDGANFLPYIGLSFTTTTPAPIFGYSKVASSGFTSNMPTNYIRPVSYTIRNTGNIVWWGESGTMPGSSPTRLYTINPAYHSSIFYHSSSWLASNQLSIAQPGALRPGQDAHFGFSIKTPTTHGIYSEDFGLIIDGVSPYPVTEQIKPTIEVADYAYSLVSSNLPATLNPGQKYDVTIVAQNTGTATWYADGSTPPGISPARMITAGYSSHPLRDMTDTRWINNSQIKMTTASVAPGENAEFKFTFQTPLNSTSVTSDFKIILDGVYMMSGLIQKSTNVPALQYSYQHIGGNHPALTPLSTGQITTGKLILRNTSNFVWYSDTSRPTQFSGGSVRMVMTDPYYRQSSFANSVDAAWLGTQNQIKMTTSIVNPGENAEFDFTWKAPLQSGSYRDKFSLVLDGYGLFPFIGMELTSTVQ